MTLATGAILHNRYRIAKLVGQGGFGAVYRAWDMALNRRVAVKENFETGSQSQRQFEREAQLLAALRHPNLPVVGDHFILPGQGQYLVMDFVEGKSLDQLLREKGEPLGEAEVLPWIRQVCDALDFLHTQLPPIIHRDIKPKNIIIAPSGHAMLVDFGISKIYDPNQGTTMGAKGVTPGYSPPEQYGRGRTDARSDIYALGATLYTLLTGQEPPAGPDLSSGADELTPPRQLNPKVSAATSAAIVAAMAPTMGQRLQSAAALARALVDTTPLHPSTPLLPPARTSKGSPPTISPATPGPALKRREGTVQLWVGAVLAIAVLSVWAFWTFGTSGRANNGGQQPTLSPQATQLVAGGGSPTPRPSMSPTATATPSATPTSISTATATPHPSATPTITPTPLPQAGDVRTLMRGNIAVEQVYVPAGSFVMGSDGGGIPAEQPGHGVTLDPFWLDRTEVTNAQYEACVITESCQPPSERSSQTRGTYYDDFRYSNYPVVNVNWDDASTFCQWAGGRLPTEAEWEYGARGPESYPFPWGDKIPSCDLANYGDCLNDTTEVGSYPDGASWVSALDMAGNVWEWVNDWYHSDYYRESPGENPTGPTAGSTRVERGGAFYSGPYVYARSAYRASNSPINTYNNLGFRCAQD